MTIRADERASERVRRAYISFVQIRLAAPPPNDLAASIPVFLPVFAPLAGTALGVVLTGKQAAAGRRV